ncbi:MAG: sigma-70 family RNA polymerase sigma factor [Acidimicrobiales bacterium]
MRAAQKGDTEALDQLLRRHHDKVWGICRRLAGNDADALDATQEALIAVATRLNRFDGKSRFTTWLYRVTTNACLDELRRRARRPLVGLDAAFEPLDLSAPPVDGLVADRLLIDAALARLPEEFRVAVVLRDLLDLDYAEISEILDIPPGTVRSRIARGRGALATFLRPGDQTDLSERQNL